MYVSSLEESLKTGVDAESLDLTLEEKEKISLLNGDDTSASATNSGGNLDEAKNERISALQLRICHLERELITVKDEMLSDFKGCKKEIEDETLLFTTNLDHRSLVSTANIEHRLKTIEDKNEGDPLLPPDSFSLLVTTRWCRSRTSFLAIIVLFIQLLTLFLVFEDSLPKYSGTKREVYEMENENELGLPIPENMSVVHSRTQTTVLTHKYERETKNLFGFPIDVSLAVRIAEYIAIIIAVFTQDDLVRAFHLLGEGYDPEEMRISFGEACAPCKWWIHVFLRLIEGAFGLFVTFILIMQQETVLELLLNFTALEFVAKLDDVAFKLFQFGFFGSHARKEAKKIVAAKRKESDSAKIGKLHRAVRPMLLCIVFVSLTVGFAIIEHKQSTGEYMRLEYPNCYPTFRDWESPRIIGDGYCHHDANNEECGWDGGDCIVPEYPNCHPDYPDYIGDGYCDAGLAQYHGENNSEYNSTECGWDGGDCL
eukprot:CAMPEP_0183711696 /NCGR_PEP_ID=MMETSP0737-20130205/7137_1 /TAXON_ID=385413 /ORGANISM="Thalassiosira miniscula, Strain CCMP1093" /LENGTH=483 /DNA_ID=CAMNT_0025940263 /DNA_START=64 /DNA_END=1515 /DNA_ORIENTATION=+